MDTLRSSVDRLDRYLTQFLLELDEGDSVALDRAKLKFYTAYDLCHRYIDHNKVSWSTWRDIEIDVEVEGQVADERVLKLNKLTLIYNLILFHLKLSDQLIKMTAPISRDIEYYDSVLASKKTIGIYCVQTSPILAYNWGKEVYQTIVENEQLLTPQWVPNVLKNLYNQLVNLARRSAKVSRSYFKKLRSPNFLMLKNLQQNRFNYVKAVFGAPFYSMRQQIITKRQQLVDLKYENAVKLGLLLDEMPIFTSESDIELFYSQLDSKLTKLNVEFGFNTINLGNLIDTIPQIRSQIKNSHQSNGKPSFAYRYWFLLVLGLLYIPSTLNNIIQRQLEIWDWIQTNLIDSLIGFYQNWIVKPVTQIIGTIRHDSDSEIAIMSQKSLSSDLDSLTRMVIDFVVDNQSIPEADLQMVKADIVDNVSKGDLTSIMENYEVNLKKPMVNLIKGNLLRNLLIQIQKLKVDGDIAMSGIDKLLKSQELVFTMMALSPSILICYLIGNSIYSYFTVTSYSISEKLTFKSKLNNIERLISNKLSNQLSSKSNYKIDGLLLLEILDLKNLGESIIKENKTDWTRDCNDLLDNRMSDEFKLRTINRIWNLYL